MPPAKRAFWPMRKRPAPVNVRADKWPKPKGLMGLLVRGWAIVIVLCVSVVGVFGVTGPDAHARRASWLRVGSPAEEIRYLNAQRRENGIPGGLVNVPDLSLGCYEFENMYVRKPGQYPHEEVLGQPGYTALGSRAAAFSDLADGVGPRPLWGDRAIDNAWADAPLHLVSLFNPTARYAWFGGGPLGACMGTGSENPLHQTAAPVERRFRSPAFFSLPGNGVSDVWPLQAAADAPFAPQQAVHIPAGQPTGPNIILFPEGTQARIGRVELRSLSGRRIPVRVVTPTTPTPPFPAGWPAVKFMGEGFGDVWFVIPTRPLRGDTRYRLTALWSEGAGRQYAQRVRFKTLCQGLGGPCPRQPPA